MARPKFEQHVAVFGESGSGKTVLLSSFYGAAQEPRNVKASGSHLIGATAAQGNKLHSNYLGMKNSARLPAPDKFKWTSYEFDLKLKQDPRFGGGTVDALRLVWHDYPGEWFEGRRDSARERARQIDSFRALLGSDVAFLLIDGQRILDNKGEEERYLKNVFANFRNTLLSMRDEILDDGKKLIQFPRIWFIALSKADLNPELDVYGLRDLVVEKAAGEVELLREVLASFVVSPDALSVGEDFLLLSSAEFDPGTINVERRVGLDYLLPVAAMMPFERHVAWANTMKLPSKVAEALLRNSWMFAVVLNVVAKKLPGPVAKIMNKFGTDLITEAAAMMGLKLREFNKNAVAKGDVFGAKLSRFKIDLEEAEESATLLKSLT